MKKSFVRLTGFGIVLVLMIFVATRNGWSQEAGKQPPAEGNASKQPASARPDLSSSSLIPKTMEDFSTPALTSSTSLKSLQALQMELDDDDAKFTREVVRVQWRSGDPIDLYIIKPAGVKNPPDHPLSIRLSQRNRSVPQSRILPASDQGWICGRRFRTRIDWPALSRSAHERVVCK